MKLPDGTILVHAATPYDPTKAHNYYLKTRKLHPRQGRGTYTVTSGDKKIKLSAQQLEEQRAYAVYRTTQIKKSLSALTVLLKDKMKKAKEADAKAAKPPTAADKAQTARDSAKYRDSHQQKLASKAKQTANKTSSSTSSASKTNSVDSLKKEISSTKANLKAAVAKQRDLATAKKNG